MFFISCSDYYNVTPVLAFIIYQVHFLGFPSCIMAVHCCVCYRMECSQLWPLRRVRRITKNPWWISSWKKHVRTPINLFNSYQSDHLLSFTLVRFTAVYDFYKITLKSTILYFDFLYKSRGGVWNCNETFDLMYTKHWLMGFAKSVSKINTKFT